MSGISGDALCFLGGSDCTGYLFRYKIDTRIIATAAVSFRLCNRVAAHCVEHALRQFHGRQERYAFARQRPLRRAVARHGHELAPPRLGHVFVEPSGEPPGLEQIFHAVRLITAQRFRDAIWGVTRGHVRHRPRAFRGSLGHRRGGRTPPRTRVALWLALQRRLTKICLGTNETANVTSKSNDNSSRRVLDRTSWHTAWQRAHTRGGVNGGI